MAKSTGYRMTVKNSADVVLKNKLFPYTKEGRNSLVRKMREAANEASEDVIVYGSFYNGLHSDIIWCCVRQGTQVLFSGQKGMMNATNTSGRIIRRWLERQAAELKESTMCDEMADRDQTLRDASNGDLSGNGF